MQIRRTLSLAAFLSIGTLSAAGQVPTITSVLNAADLTSRVSPGTIVDVFGTNFGSGSPSTVSLQVGVGFTAYIISVSPTELVAQLPLEAPTGAVNLTVTAGGQTSAPLLLTIGDYAPALFTVNQNGTGAGVFTDSTGAIVSATAPAKPGDVVSAYAVGLGATNPFTPTGTPGVLSNLSAKVSVTVGGLAASLGYVGATPGQIGTYQVSFTIPPNLHGTVPVVLSLGALHSNSIDLPLSGGIKTINAASLAEGTVAPDSYLAAQGVGLASGAAVSGLSSTLPYQTTFGGTTVKVKDSASIERLALISYVSANQVNYVLPAGTATGVATVTVTAADGTISSGQITVASVSPGLFVYSPTNIAAANVIRARNGTSTAELTYALTGTSQTLVAAPIDLGPATDTVALVLYGTGIRGRVSLNVVTLTVGGLTVPIDYAGAQGQYPALDQVNITLPRSLAGKGDVAIQLTVDGKAANPVHVTIK